MNTTDNGGGNSFGRGNWTKESLCDLCKRQGRMSDYDVGISNLSKPSVGEERSSSGRSARLEYSIPSDEGQIIRACRFKAGQARDGGLWRSHKLSADYIVNLLK
jgi:hypothetical protein